MKDHGQRVGRVDAGDRAVIDLPRRDHAGRRMDDALVARLDIRRGQFRSIVKEDIRAQLEGVSLPIGRHAPGLRQIANDLRIIGGIELQQGRIVRRHRMQKREGGVAVAIIIAGLDGNREFERAAAFRRDFSTAPRREGKNRSENSRTYQPKQLPAPPLTHNRCNAARIDPGRPLSSGSRPFIVPH